MNSLLAKKYQDKPKEEIPRIEIEDAREMIDYADHDEDGVLDFAEFAKILMNKGAKKPTKKLVINN